MVQIGAIQSSHPILRKTCEGIWQEEGRQPPALIMPESEFLERIAANPEPMRASVQTLTETLSHALAKQSPTQTKKVFLAKSKGCKVEKGMVTLPDSAPYNLAIINLTLGHARLSHGDITGLEMIRDAWAVDKSCEPPWEFYVKEWIEERITRNITHKWDKQHPIALNPKQVLGSVRNVVFESDSSIGQLPADQREQSLQTLFNFMKADENSVFGDTLVWHQPLVAPTTLCTPTTHDGAVAHSVRIADEIFSALTPDEFKAGKARIAFDIDDVLLSFLHPDLTEKQITSNWGKYRKPMLMAFEQIDSLGWMIKSGDLYTPIKIARVRPTLLSPRGAVVVFEVEIPIGEKGFMMVIKDTLRRTAKARLPQNNAAKACFWLIDTYGVKTNSRGKHYIVDPTKPDDRNRDREGFLIRPDTGERIFSNKGPALKDPKHPEAAAQLPRIPDPRAQKKYPLVTASDRVRAAFPQGHSLRNADAQKRADSAFLQLHKGGDFIVDTEPEDAQKDDWRVMPTENHVKTYRAVSNVSDRRN